MLTYLLLVSVLSLLGFVLLDRRARKLRESKEPITPNPIVREVWGKEILRQMEAPAHLTHRPGDIVVMGVKTGRLYGKHCSRANHPQGRHWCADAGGWANSGESEEVAPHPADRWLTEPNRGRALGLCVHDTCSFNGPHWHGGIYRTGHVRTETPGKQEAP